VEIISSQAAGHPVEAQKSIAATSGHTHTFVIRIIILNISKLSIRE
jgi:hypothetical protein